jgi:hypothetical protein
VPALLLVLVAVRALSLLPCYPTNLIVVAEVVSRPITTSPVMASRMRHFLHWSFASVL